MYLLLILRPVRVRRDLPIVPVIVHIIILLIFRVDKGSNVGTTMNITLEYHILANATLKMTTRESTIIETV